MRFLRSLPLLAVAAVVVSAGPARACFMRSPLPVQVWLDHITVDITDQVAVKTYNCTFKNANRRAVVGGTCYMELEPGAQVDNMSVLVDGKEMKAEILDVDKAKEVFADIVKKGGSPALLEYYGNQLIQTQVPRVAPGGTVTVKLTYTTVLKKRGGLVRLQMLNTNPKALMQPLKSASVRLRIKSTAPIKNVYSPTHEIDIAEQKGWDVVVNWKKDNYLPKHPFVFYYQTAAETVGASLIAHRELDEPGQFMLMLSPTIGTGAGAITDAMILPKDVVFCVDTSGSMLKDGKMEQARGALKYCVEHLRKGDRFNIVDFSTIARNFNDEGLVAASGQSLKKAARYIEKMHARGGTAIGEALELSLKHLGGQPASGPRRLKMIVFATDGLPTIGETDPEKLLRAMARKNKQDVRVFVFGEGFDVNTKLLDFLALGHRGEADYILPKENITEKISRFFDRVGSPVMTDLEVSFAGLKVDEVYPRRIADVFKGEQVIVYGRYTGHGEKKVKVTGTVGGKRQTFEYTLSFPEVTEDDTAAFVPRLWAGKKVDYILNEIRKTNQPSKELIDEVTRLAKRYGIITPYTSYLVTDDVAGRPTAGGPGFGIGGGALNRPVLQLRAARGRFLDRLKSAQNAAPGAVTPVEDSKRLAEFRRKAGKSGGAGALDGFAEVYSKDKYGKKKSSLQAVRYIGRRTFYNLGGIWFDSRFDASKISKMKPATKLKIGSKEYFKLLKDEPGVAKYLALGNVVVHVKGTWYQIESVKK